jgi:ATP-dependent DNA helicase PIF1
MTYNKSQSQTLSKVLLDITTPPFSHGQLYVALSRVRDCNNIRMYLTEEQLIINESHLTGFMPSVNNIVYQDVLIHNS